MSTVLFPTGVGVERAARCPQALAIPVLFPTGVGVERRSHTFSDVETAYYSPRVWGLKDETAKALSSTRPRKGA